MALHPRQCVTEKREYCAFILGLSQDMTVLFKTQE